MNGSVDLDWGVSSRLSQAYIGVRMTRTPDFLYKVDDHSSLATKRMSPTNLRVPDFHFRVLGGVDGWFNG